MPPCSGFLKTNRLMKDYIRRLHQTRSCEAAISWLRDLGAPGLGAPASPAGVKQRRAERSLNGTMSEVKMAMPGRNVRNMEHGMRLAVRRFTPAVIGITSLRDVGTRALPAFIGHVGGTPALPCQHLLHNYSNQQSAISNQQSAISNLNAQIIA